MLSLGQWLLKGLDSNVQSLKSHWGEATRLVITITCELSLFTEIKRELIVFIIIYLRKKDYNNCNYILNTHFTGTKKYYPHKYIQGIVVTIGSHPIT